jgi:hypothetical protein
VLKDQSSEALAVPIVGADRRAGAFLLCKPAKSRWRWLRRGAVHAIDIALAAGFP